VTIDGVRFWGAPWYSDLFGRRDAGHLRFVEGATTDFSPKIDDFGRWTIARHQEEHARQTMLLREEADLVDVVITHWPPTHDAFAPRFKGGGLNGYFVNDREDLVVDIGAQIWISGHVHEAYRAVVGNALVIGNPAGYPREAAESWQFRPDFAIEMETAGLGSRGLSKQGNPSTKGARIMEEQSMWNCHYGSIAAVRQVFPIVGWTCTKQLEQGPPSEPEACDERRFQSERRRCARPTVNDFGTDFIECTGTLLDVLPIIRVGCEKVGNPIFQNA